VVKRGFGSAGLHRLQLHWITPQKHQNPSHWSAAAGPAVKHETPIQTAVPSDGLLVVTCGFFQKFREDGYWPEKIPD
jgi:hypothetical protein